MKGKKIVYVTFIPEGASLEFEDSLYIGVSAVNKGVGKLEGHNTKTRK